MQLACKSLKTYVSSVSPSSERMEELWVVCVIKFGFLISC